MLRRVESEQELLECLRQDIAAKGVRVRIGQEVRVPGLDECSFVTAPCGLGGERGGGVGIGVMGPTRMDYRAMCAFVQGAAKAVANVFARWAAHE